MISSLSQASQELSSSTSSNRFPASLAFPWASWLGREWPCPQHHHLNLCHNIINPSALIKLYKNYHHHMISHNIINLFSAPIKLLKNFQNRVLQKKSSHICYYLFSSLYASITNHKRLFSGVPHCMFGRIKGRQIWRGVGCRMKGVVGGSAGNTSSREPVHDMSSSPSSSSSSSSNLPSLG